MKKIFTLLTAFAMTATFASAEIFTVKGPNDGIIGQGAVLDNTGSAIVVTSISATTAKNKDMLKTANDKFADGTLANAFCKSSIKFRLDAAPTVENPDGTANAGSTAFKIVVNEDIKALNLYAEAAAGKRSFNLFNRATGEITTKSFTTVKGTDPAVAGTNIGYIATWSDVVAGEYTLYLTGFGGGFCGITYETAGSPAPISWSEKSQTIQLGSEYTLPTFSNTDPEIAVSFVSSNPEVATVSENGKISLAGNGVGTAVITATYEGEKYDKTEVSCEITVVSTVDPEFAFSAAEATVNFGGDMSSLPTLVMSEDIAASDVTYSVTPAGIAEVKDGIINVLAAGKATITATFAGNDKYSSATATCVVTALPQKEIKVGEVILAIGAIGDDVDSGKKDNEGNVIYKSIVAAGTNIFDDANITVTNVSATLRANDSKNICGADMTNYIQVRNQNAENTELTITPKANMEFVVYGRLQDKSADQPVIQNTKNFTLNESGSALKSTMHFSEWLVGGAEKPYEYFLMGQSFTLEAGKTYTLTAGGFGFRLYGFSYTAEAPAEIAAPTHNQEGETVKVNGSQEVVFTPAADHHVVYTYFEAATAPEVETLAADETVEHEGKTFTLATDNKVTVDKSGTLHYFAMDPETKATSPVNTIAFDVTTGIADIDVDSENAPVEYFNMQGIRVANPQNGLYIRRQGNKVEKVYVK